jgi:UPF0755 protein
LIFMVILAAGGLGLWWINQPLALRVPVVDLSIEPGTSPRGVAQDAVDAGVVTSPQLLYWWFRLSGEARQIKAGSYELQGDVSPRRLLSKLVRGEEALRAVTLVEGLTFKQFRQILQKAEQLTQDIQGLEADLIMQKLERPGLAPEGHFYPDTYTYTKGSSDLAVLKRALHAMDKHLEAAWQTRPSNSPLKSPDELLTLASIVEKETGLASDRPMIASVFTNRLRIGMMLQTDPTVIYGLGDKFDGNLRRRDLLADTPWNTYTRAGLPPTPIAMPGKAALLAAAQPAASKALYFVAKGDGSSQFSDTLDAHNRAVAKYQLGR